MTLLWPGHERHILPTDVLRDYQFIGETAVLFVITNIESARCQSLIHFVNMNFLKYMTK